MWRVREVGNITSYLSFGSQKITVYAVVELPTSKYLGEQLIFYDHMVTKRQLITSPPYPLSTSYERGLATKPSPYHGEGWVR